MQLPIDIKAVMDASLDIEQARTTPLQVSVYLDDSAPLDVQAHIRQAYASASGHARVTLNYLSAAPVAANPDDDAVVIVAGLLEQVGQHAAAFRQGGVPTMVVTTMPDLVEEIAKAQNHPIPKGDVLSPHIVSAAPALKAPAADAAASEPAAEGDAGAAEPFELTPALAASLDERMGAWIIETCKEKRLAFALAFPFVRRPLSLEAVRATAMQNAGVGLFVMIPGADLPVMTLNQAKMLLMIAAAYGEPLGMERVKELAAVVGGAFACRAAARQVVAFVPAIGWAVKGAIGYTGTYAMGRAAIQYFEDGESAQKLVDVVSGARDKVVRAAGKRVVQKAQAKGASTVDAAMSFGKQVLGNVTKVTGAVGDIRATR